MAPELNSLMERIEKVEKQNRRMKRTGVTAILLGSAFLVMGQTAPSGRTLEAQHFVLKDSTGSTRAELVTSGKLGPVLRLLDNKGSVRAALMVADAIGPSLQFYSTDGAPAVSIEVSDILGAHLTLADGKGGQSRLNPEGLYLPSAPAVALNDPTNLSGGTHMVTSYETFLSHTGLTVSAGPTGKPTSELRVAFLWSPQRGPSLILNGTSGNAALAIEEQGPSLAMHDQRRYSSVLGVVGLETPVTGETHQTTAASIVLLDKGGKVLWRAPLQ